MSRIPRLALRAASALCLLTATALAVLHSPGVPRLAAAPPNAAERVEVPAGAARGPRPDFRDYSDDPDALAFFEEYDGLLAAADGLRGPTKYRTLVEAAAREDARAEAASRASGMLRTFADLRRLEAREALDVLLPLSRSDDPALRRTAGKALYSLPVYDAANLGGEPCYVTLVSYLRKAPLQGREEDLENLLWCMYYRDRNAALNTIMMVVAPDPAEADHATVAKHAESIRHSVALWNIDARFKKQGDPELAGARARMLTEVRKPFEALCASDSWYARAWAADFASKELIGPWPSEWKRFKDDASAVVKRLASSHPGATDE